MPTFTVYVLQDLTPEQARFIANPLAFQYSELRNALDRLLPERGTGRARLEVRWPDGTGLRMWP